jgi:signal-transduction protein with cAMP-binding, CBS, and nucleotidyltransferase domain
MSNSFQPHPGSYLSPSFEHATVADAMRAGVLSCPPHVSAVEVARMMAEHHIHAVVVEGAGRDPADRDRLVWGVASDMDLVRVAHGIENLTAGDLAGTEPLTVEPSLPLDEAARLMAEHDITHLIVAEGRRAVGVVSTLDVAGVLAWGRA